MEESYPMLLLRNELEEDIKLLDERRHTLANAKVWCTRLENDVAETESRIIELMDTIQRLEFWPNLRPPHASERVEKCIP